MTRNREIRALTRELEERCRFIADTLRFRQLASEKELADYLPGGEQNKDKTVRGWIFCYANFVRFCDRIPDENTPKRTPESDDEVIRALADTPEVVALTSGATITVYPKSFIALQYIERCDARIAWLTRKREQLIARDGRDDLELTERINDEVAYEYSVMAWIATHTGPQMPFEEFEQRNAELPPHIVQLSTIDVLSIRNAFVRVNAARLLALTHLLKDGEKGDGSRLSWQTFFALKEDEKEVPASTLMRDRSLCSQVASSILVADAQHTAVEAAKRGEMRA